MQSEALEKKIIAFASNIPSHNDFFQIIAAV